MAFEPSPAAQRYADAQQRLAGLRDRADLAEAEPGWEPAHRLWESSAVLSKLLGAGARAGQPQAEISVDELGAALAVFEELRIRLDELECQVIMEARRRGLEWQQIRDEQGLRSPQAAAQRYQRLMTRLEEIRQGVR
ncbi:hypothetical protein [Kitasatospora sp. LaBMicrA B282]|uniref:hypothetical protein n=1 Tax=Kitasatospora sp. LaBMicrA B282 TaxID=3420949 RepID=UPI003D0FF4B5